MQSSLLEQEQSRDTHGLLPAVIQQLRRRRVPQILQMSAVECGAACLAMILSYYGHKTNIAEIRERCGVGRDGVSAHSIVRAARDYGLRVRAISLKKNDFRDVKLPAIAHWQFDHFLVVERWRPSHVDVVDPATGRMRYTAEEFEQSFTGVVLLFEPGVHFQRQRGLARMNIRTYVASWLYQAPWTLLQILAASLLLQVFGLGVPILTEITVDRIIPSHHLSVMAILGLGMIVLLATQLVTMLLRAILLVYLQAHVDMSMMLGFFEHLLSLPLGFFQQRASGDIIARMNSNTLIRETLSNQLISTVLDGSFVTVYVLILFWQSQVFGLLVLIIGALQVGLLLVTNRPLRELSMRELIAQGRSQSYATEVLGGMVSLKAAGAEQRAFQHWSNLLLEQLNVSVRRITLSSIVDTTIRLLQSLAPFVLLWVGTLQVLNGSLEVGTMLALNALAMAFFMPLASLVSSGQKLQLVRSHLERLVDVMEADPEQSTQSVQQPPRLSGQIELKDVSFRYAAQSPDVLKNVNLTIEAGQKVAIVGRTGSGKSTLGKLLLGLYVPTQGEVLYDGMPLQSLNYQAVRAQFGTVMQEATVFSGTIRQNIAFNDPEMALDGIVQAARMAGLHEDIMSMPMGYETYVSEQGSALSGGQRQRLALARALAHTPVLLLLDEATSSLDTVTEHAVEQNITNLDCTQIIIAHRLSTVRNADRILVLDEGIIVESGTHQELLCREGYYAKLVQRQFAPEQAQAE
ncbi:MAG TPA: peptidase domain-containing ABC transporter [Ktedonobacteraceae bacterium]|nr:peptidase domain-containing ABC transporter [Ktedonobacteraceae bacterium]